MSQAYAEPPDTQPEIECVRCLRNFCPDDAEWAAIQRGERFVCAECKAPRWMTAKEQDRKEQRDVEILAGLGSPSPAGLCPCGSTPRCPCGAIAVAGTGTCIGCTPATHGTDWCAPGEGATVGELLNILAGDRPPSMFSDSREAWRHISCDLGTGDRQTNLRLTGRPLVAYDLERIAACEVTRARKYRVAETAR
jgi:hypothetical protein